MHESCMTFARTFLFRWNPIDVHKYVSFDTYVHVYIVSVLLWCGTHKTIDKWLLQKFCWWHHSFFFWVVSPQMGGNETSQTLDGIDWSWFTYVFSKQLLQFPTTFRFEIKLLCSDGLKKWVTVQILIAKYPYHFQQNCIVWSSFESDPVFISRCNSFQTLLTSHFWEFWSKIIIECSWNINYDKTFTEFQMGSIEN